MGSPRPDPRRREEACRKVIDGVNGLEPGEAPQHVGGVARGCQGGPQIVLLCGIDLVAGKRVEVVGKADACHVTEPWLAGTITGRRGDLRPKFRVRAVLSVCVVMTQMVVITPGLRNCRP